MTSRLSVGELAEAFDALIDLDPSGRDLWFARTTLHPDDRLRLERLLRIDAEQQFGLLDESAATHAAALESPSDRFAEPSDLVGQQFGAFRLTALIGQGGMATVFLGQRVGADFDQQVAVKLLRRGLYSSMEQQLFRRERRVLAQLDHPGVARLIDGGVTEAGIPYLVMEYVDGLRLDQHVQSHALDLAARLRLFVAVCRAVEAAHQALIVHRDIKPSNILVTTAGTPKLLDFGIAKLLADEADSDASRTFTAALTPGYAAPEQLLGTSVTTSADIYALGVVLHELLTGTRPSSSEYTPASASVRAADASSAGRLPLPPAALRRALRGDLDNIILRARAPEPSRRYPSVSALADDIESHLAGRAVRAHPPARWYLMAKFVRRHRVAVSITATLTLLLLTAFATALVQAETARNQARRAGEVQHFVEAMFAPLESGNDNGGAPTLQELLRRSLARIDAQAPKDPQVRAELLTMFARINDGIGEVKGNLQLAQMAWQAAASAWGEDDLRSLDARLLLGKVLRRNSQYERALDTFEATREGMLRAGVGGIRYVDLLDMQLNARMDVERIPDDEVIARRRELLAMRKQAHDTSPEAIASGYNQLGNAFEDARDYQAAADAYERAFELRHAALGDSASAAVSLANVGNAYSWLKQWRKAIDMLDRARAMYERTGTTRHPNYAQLLIRLCHLRTLTEDFARAATDCSAGIEAFSDPRGPDPGSHGMAWLRDASRLLAIGEPVRAQHRFEGARRLFNTTGRDIATNQRSADIAEAARWRALGDFPMVRDRLAPIADNPGYATHWAAPLINAWLVQACAVAPGAGCEGDRRAAAQALLAEPRFATDPLQIPARTAMLECSAPGAETEAAIAALQAALEAAEEIPAGHSWRGEAYLALARAHTGASDRRQALARAKTIIDALPPGHALHAAYAAMR